MKKWKLLFYLMSLFIIHTAKSQGITGTWQGRMSDEWLQMSIVQNKNELCGFTYDIVLNDRNSFCKAYFRGTYDRESGIYQIHGISFIDNIGGHVLMTLRFWIPDKRDKNTIRGIVSTGSMFEDYLGFSAKDKFTLKRVSKVAKPAPGRETPCYAPIKQAPNASIKKVPEKPVSPSTKEPAKVLPTKPKVTKPLPAPPVSKPLPKKDSLIQTPVTKKLVEQKLPDQQVVKKLNARKNTELSSLTVDSRFIQLKVYDNGIVDNDTVSIYYNGRLIKSKQQLSEKALEINLELDENSSTHEITLFAENLGTIPPNTAIIVVTAGSKRYELHSSASMVENAVLHITYEPPGIQ